MQRSIWFCGMKIYAILDYERNEWKSWLGHIQLVHPLGNVMVSKQNSKERNQNKIIKKEMTFPWTILNSGKSFM